VGGNFQIRFQAVPEILFAGLNTFTITLRPDGTHRVDYGQTNTIWFALAGRSPGAGAPDPGPTDLSVAAQPLGQTHDTVYEEFFLGDDLASLSLEYAPCGLQVAVPEPGLTPPAAALLQSLPNPFRSRTVIGFDLPAAGPVRLRVFDLQGRWIHTLVDQNLPAGRYAIPWRGDDAQGQPAGAGVYFYRLETPSFEATRKTVLLP
jgi:hypothetical protein